MHLRFLGVFQPGPQVGQDLACLPCCARFSGLHCFTQARHHLSNGPQLLRYGGALKIKRVTFLVCSDQDHLNLCLLF